MLTPVKRSALVVVVAVSACLPAEPEVFTVTVSGAVTEAGVPISGAMLQLFRLSEVTGLPEAVGAATTSANGAFSFSTSVSERFCPAVFVTVDVRGPTGATTLQRRTKRRGMRGQHVELRLLVLVGVHETLTTTICTLRHRSHASLGTFALAFSAT